MNVIYTGNRCLKDDSETDEKNDFDVLNIAADKIDLIDDKEYSIRPISVYVQYGTYDMNNDQGGRTFIENFNEVEIDTSKFECINE